MHVIFDLDGTLADSAILTIAAVRRVAPEYGLAVPSDEDIRKTIGYANPEFYDRLFPGHPTELARRAGEMIEREELRVLSGTPGQALLFPGCRELLEELRSRGHSLSIASTGSHEHVHAILDTARIGGYFAGVHCGRPDKTDMLRRITGGLREGFIMVGDMRKDSDAARAVGIPSVGASYGYCIREATCFDLYIDAPLELLGVLENHKKIIHKNF